MESKLGGRETLRLHSKFAPREMMPVIQRASIP